MSAADGVRVWRVRSHFRTGCLMCGRECPADDRNNAAHARWARSHARRNPGHRVALEVTYDRVFEATL